jgi:hypothetical protein
MSMTWPKWHAAFIEWLLAQAGRDDPIGGLARLAADQDLPRGVSPIAKHLEANGASETVIDALYSAWREWYPQAPPRPESKPRKPRKPRRKAPSPRQLYAHGCMNLHNTHKRVAECYWPRPTTRKHVFGDGPWGVCVVRYEYYPDHDGVPGALAYWPDIYLSETRDEANDRYWQIADQKRRLRDLYVFMLPDDPRDVVEYEDRTLDGIHAQYAVTR